MKILGNIVLTPVFTILGHTALVVGTLVLASLATLVGWIPPRGNWTYQVARIWSRVLLWGGGILVRRRFGSPLPSDRGFVYMANHQSMYDIPALIATLPGQTRFLAKKSLFSIPIFGWSIRAGGFIPVDRTNRATAKETFTIAVECLRSGRSILVFPEETRSFDGELLPFKAGGFLMALKTGFPIVPVGIRGIREVQSRTSYLIHPGRVQVCYGDPIDPADYGVRGRAQLTADVRQRILELAGKPPAA